MENEFDDKQILINLGQKKKIDSKIIKNSEYIKKIIELTNNSNILSKKTIETVQNIEKPKLKFLSKIIKYLKDLIFKYVIAPEIKRLEKEEKLIKQQNSQKRIDDIKELLYNSMSYENKKYFDRLDSMKKESGCYLPSKFSLLYNPEDVLLHNNELTKDKPSIFTLKENEFKNINKQLKNQELLKRKVEKLLSKEDTLGGSKPIV
jgi:hypothetical protein